MQIYGTRPKKKKRKRKTRPWSTAIPVTAILLIQNNRNMIEL